MGDAVPFTFFSPIPLPRSPRCYQLNRHSRSMADLLVVVAVLGFVAAMLGLIWGLERV
jgi:hypothetical protein